MSITFGCGGGPAAATDNNPGTARCGIDTTPTVAVSRQNAPFRADFVRLSRAGTYARAAGRRCRGW